MAGNNADTPGFNDGGSRPVPDPTILTTQQLVREVTSLKEVVFTRLDGMDKAIELFNENITRVPTDTDKQINQLRTLVEAQSTLKKDAIDVRFSGMDKALELVRDTNNRFSMLMDDKVHSLQHLQDEKFNSIQTQFRERDVRTEQSWKDSKVAVEAALQAAKEAVGEQNKSSSSAIAKSEAATAKQIDQIMQLIQTGNKATDDKIADIKDRLTRIEGNTEGSYKVKHDSSVQIGVWFGIAILAIGVFMDIVLHFIK